MLGSSKEASSNRDAWRQASYTEEVEWVELMVGPDGSW